MKKYSKLICLLLSLLMAIGCFAACSGDKGQGEDGSGEKSEMTPEEAKSEYEKLDNTAKLFYTPAASSPAADKVASIVDAEEIKKPDIKLDGFEAAAEISVNKFTAGGEDLLQSLGGALNVNGSVLVADSGANFDLAAAVNGTNIDIDIAADKDGALLTAPFLFSQPVYLSGSILGEALNSTDAASAFSSVPSVDLKGIASALESWSKEKLTDENIKHLSDLFKGVIPEEAVSVSEVKPAEFKGNYIKDDITAECVTLTVDKAVYDKMAQSAKNDVVADSVLKDVVVSFLNCFGDELLSSSFGMTAEEIYEKFVDELNEGLSDPADDDFGTIVLSRYFVSGLPAKLDLAVKDEKTEYLNFTCWDVYSDANAREYGAKLSVEGKEYLNVRGGANENAADMAATVGFLQIGNPPEMDSYTKVPMEVGKLTFTARRDENGFAANGSVESDEAGITATLDMTDKDGNVTAKAEAELSGYKVAVDYTGTAADGDINMTFSDTDGKNGCEIKAHTKAEGGKYSFDADLTAKADGQPAGSFNLKVEHEVTKDGGKTEQNAKIALSSEGIMEFEASLKLTSDESTDKKPASPSKDGAYVIENEEDAEGLADIINPTLIEMFGSSAPVIGNLGVAA